MNSFHLVGLPAATFASFFAMDAAQLERHGARRVIADAAHGFPCRVSLVDAQVGDELLLLPFEHQAALSPYRSSGPVFVRKTALQAELEPGELPPYVTRRKLSVRAYDAAHMMVAGELCDGSGVREPLVRLLADEAVSYIHLHNAARGCYSCRVDRS